MSRFFNLFSASAAGIFSILSANIADAKTIGGPKNIDGFQVKILPLPTFDKIPRPDSVVGEVKKYVGSRNHAFDPFYMLPDLQNVSPYLAIYPGSSATFTFLPRNTLSFYWGTPDSFNAISFYSGGQLVGTLLGADFQQAYGFSEINRPFPVGYEDLIRIKSNVPFDSVVLSDVNHCCFEFSILRPF